MRGGHDPSAHQRKSFCVKGLVGASSVVCPCIAVMGLVPAACDRVGETTGGAAHDVRRDHRGVSMPRRARPDRPLVRDAPVWSGGDAVSVAVRVPWVAMSGSQALAGGDHGVQVAQDRGGDDGLGLGRA